MNRCQQSFKKIPSNLWVVCIGSNSFQGISYAGKPQVVSSYSFKSMFTTLLFFKTCNAATDDCVTLDLAGNACQKKSLFLNRLLGGYSVYFLHN